MAQIKKTAPRTTIVTAPKTKRPFGARVIAGALRAAKWADKCAQKIAESDTTTPAGRARIALLQASGQLRFAAEQLPADYRPARKTGGGGRSSITVGSRVTVSEKRWDLYAGLFEDMTVEMTVKSMVGSTRALCLTDDGERSVFPIMHLTRI